MSKIVAILPTVDERLDSFRQKLWAAITSRVFVKFSLLLLFFAIRTNTFATNQMSDFP